VLTSQKLRPLTALAAAAVLSVGLTSCAGSASDGAGSGSQVTIWATSQANSAEKVMAGMIDDFNQSYPGGGHVSIEWIGGEQWKTKVAVAMAAHAPPTVFYTFGGQLLDQYVDGGNVMDLTDALAADPAWKSAYSAKNVFDLATYKGRTYGIPAGGPDFEVMWQNEAVLRKAGAAPSPATWSAFQDVVNKVKATGVAPIALAGKDLWPEMIYMQYLTLRNGGPEVFNRIKTFTPGSWSDPAVIKSAETIQDLARSGAFTNGFNTVTYASGQAEQLLASGQAAFQAMLYYDESNMRAFAPTFAASADYSAFPFPAIEGAPGDQKALVGQPAEYWGVSAKASPAQQKEATAFLKYATTSQTYNVDYLAKAGFTPMTDAGAKALQSNDVPNATLLKKLYEMGTQAPSFQPYWDQDLPSAVITPMLSNIGELFDLSITPQEFASRMNDVLAQAKS
jgi:raffinose/stachyose/melibiose transport system substrate-binding protein